MHMIDRAEQLLSPLHSAPSLGSLASLTSFFPPAHRGLLSSTDQPLLVTLPVEAAVGGASCLHALSGGAVQQTWAVWYELPWTGISGAL